MADEKKPEVPTETQEQKAAREKAEAERKALQEQSALVNAAHVAVLRFNEHVIATSRLCEDRNAGELAEQIAASKALAKSLRVAADKACDAAGM